MADKDIGTGLGPWSGADLRATAKQFAGDGADDDLDSVTRFGRSIAKLALRRMRQQLHNMRRDAIAIFLLQPNGLPNMETIRQPMLGDGGVEICGKIWFVSMTAQAGRELVPPSDEAGKMFDHIESLGLGDVPAAVFNPTVAIPTVRFYPKGLTAEDEFDTVEVADREVTINDIKRAIDEMHEEHLCTPDVQIAGNSMWSDSQKLHASSNAEAIAQTHVKLALSFRLFNCDVRPEQPMKAGRVDLEVVQQLADGASIIPAEIEIKVLRERNRRGKKWSDAFNEKWMRRGIRQAAAYRDVRKAKAGMLCCFDMRSGDRGESATFSGVKPYADAIAVELHRNFLYNDSEAWRVARYGT
ncbi:hypothetical protein [Novosphingobium sp. AAP1]|uniref:hypothetical protein n=1 Tax=Novosphingobium sp. AAP1 TaxID=1523413 RepID=UPI000A6B2D66|nr:hypothetical protein [Novosphingobium sp. AAP1]